MKTKISSTTLVRNLGDCLARVKYRGEEFRITKNDEVIAELLPYNVHPRGTWGELAEAASSYPADRDFGDDLESVNLTDTPPGNPWD